MSASCKLSHEVDRARCDASGSAATASAPWPFHVLMYSSCSSSQPAPVAALHIFMHSFVASTMRSGTLNSSQIFWLVFCSTTAPPTPVSALK